MKNHFLRLLFVLFTVTNCSMAKASENAECPKLEYAFQLKVKCDGAYTVGKTAHGKRVVIPIVGGTFEGPNIKGEILSGGADYQLVDEEQGRTEVEAIYSIKTDDGIYIHVRNCGLITTSTDGRFYFRTTPKFEAPSDSKYAWLNNSIFVCTPSFIPGYICLNIWRVI